mmetsp:Transcript_3337/g.3890  ORF Transcript_3337/g.3890 Transcript_3337/m.3890 type:complete len:969 (-) Transcript_3337:107-3013(-)
MTSADDKKKLKASAKAFVPQSMLKSSAAPWTPTFSATATDETETETEKVVEANEKSDSTKAETKAETKKVVETNEKSVSKKNNSSKTETETKTETKKIVKTNEKSNSNKNDSSKSTKTTTPAVSTTTTSNTKESQSAKAAATPAPVPVPAPAPAVSVWGKKPASAVLAAPTPKQQQPPPPVAAVSFRKKQPTNHHPKQGQGQGHHNNDKRGQWRNNHQQQPSQQQQQHGKNESWRGQNKKVEKGGTGRHHHKHEEGTNDSGWSRGKSLPLELLKPNEGRTDQEKAVARIMAEELLSLRLSFLASPLSWEKDVETGPPEECKWSSETRVQEIDATANAQRLGGDVSAKKPNTNNTKGKRGSQETAPPLEDCKPLEVNNDTRWKANVFKNDKEKDTEDGSTDDVVLKMGLLILNKLSLTKFEKLSNEFIATGIGRNEECLAGAIELIVKKAQDEPHFAAMYAALCLKLSKIPMDFEAPGKKKKFKKMLLTECQKEFEQDTETKIAKAIEGITSEEDITNAKFLVKKRYLGHMRFIGELYKGDLISIKIMLMCLPALLENEEASGNDDVDEEKIECFAKLMQVIGYSLEHQSLALKGTGKTDAYENLSTCWRTVETMAGKNKEGGPKVSNRIKFMLQDLIEMRDNGWVQRREVESAKTIAQIHKEAAQEAKRGGSMSRSASNNSIRRQSSANDILARSSKPNVDADGFVEIGKAGGGFGRSASLSNFGKSNSRPNLNKAEKSSRSVSSGGSFSAFNDVSSKGSKNKALPDVDEKHAAAAPKVQYKSPTDCGVKAVRYLKEYIVGGDMDDIILSLHELIAAGNEGSVDRGAKVMEKGTMFVLESKAEDVDKFLSVVTKCYKEKKIERESLISGLNDPLEFLTDLAIDAPMAASHLVTIVSKLIESGAISFNFLLDAPEFFRSDCGAAEFGCKVLKKLGGDAIASDTNLQVIDKLMTSKDKESYPSGAKEMLT